MKKYNKITRRQVARYRMDYRLMLEATEKNAYRAAQLARGPCDRPWNWQEFGNHRPEGFREPRL